MIDYLIIGQGISGTVLSSRLIDAGYSVLVLDPGLQNATTVAAGNVNPVTGRKFTKSWKIDDLLIASNDIYPNIEKKIGVDFLTQGEIYRPIRSIKDEHQWLSREADPAYKGYLSHLDKIPELDQYIDTPLMYGIIHKTLKLDTISLIKAYRKYLISQDSLLPETLDYNLLEIHAEYVKYKNIEAKNIVFCDGVRITSNPFFNFLPLRPTKGEVLYITTNFPQSINVRDQTFLTPQNNYFWVGSHYDKTFTTPEPTDLEKKKLVTKLDEMLKLDYKIIDHVAGIRPCVPDRKPLIGRHPSHNNMYLFNGMGTKGISLTPYLSIHLINLMTKNMEVPDEVNLRRYIK